MPDPLALIYSPLGEAGSGRVRYGAAMALYASGRISAEMLEVYRIASAHDGRDPAGMLRERGLPPLPKMTMPSPIATLYQVAREYLVALNHPGAAEVRAGLPVDPGPERVMRPRQNAVVDRWLAPALETVAATHKGLAKALADAAGLLDWVTYDSYPLDEIGADFATGHAFASLLGGDAPFAAPDFDMGFFLIRPDALYRDRRHAAPELYAPLTGPHGWRFGPGKPLQIKPAHEPIWNPPQLPHLTKVGKVPLLCLFVWTQDVDDPAVVIPAEDWARLEEISIG